MELFDFVRIARTANDGYWSYLGTDVLQIPAGEPTLNLDSFTMNTPDSEVYPVVRHDTGHTLGFPHNFKASSMYPLDSVRSKSWVAKPVPVTM